MELEEDYHRERSSGSGTEIGYTVEARENASTFIQINGQTFDKQWREVNFKELGIPQCAAFRKQTLKHGLLGYATAQTLRWWLHAQSEAEHGIALCFETRIVSHRISYSHKIETIAVHDHIHGDDRSNSMPDYGETDKTELTDYDDTYDIAINE